MSLNDLYRKKNYLKGKIGDCSKTIMELEGPDGKSGQIGKIKKEIKDLEADDKSLYSIYTNLDNARGFLKNARNFTSSAEGTLPKFYNASNTGGWVRKLEKTETSIEEMRKKIDEKTKKASSTRSLVKKEISKKQMELTSLLRKLNETKGKKSGYESELRDVYYEIEHWDDDDD